MRARTGPSHRDACPRAHMASATPERFKRLTDALVAPHETRAHRERDDTARAHSSGRMGAFDVTGARTARPLSREDYFHRLRTFRDPSRWFGKPRGASAPACAARGWILEGKDLLRCETCEALLAYPSCENIRDDVEAMESVEREMIDALATTHERGCAWASSARLPGRWVAAASDRGQAASEERARPSVATTASSGRGPYRKEGAACRRVSCRKAFSWSGQRWHEMI